MTRLQIAIPFFDRVWLLRHCLRTLAVVKGREQVHFVGVGDFGHDPGAVIAFEELLPECELILQPQHCGASGIGRGIVSRFAFSPKAERLLLLDSDMIVRTDLVSRILDWPVRADMLVSAYNSALHPPVHASAAPFLHKTSLGSTGTVWTPELAAEVVEHVTCETHFDDRFSDYLRERKTPMCSARRSLVQHLGVTGFNNQYLGLIDYGLGYEPDGRAQTEAMAAVFDHMMVNQHEFVTTSKKKRGWWRLFGGG